eukprot:Hpha_TRINITY_DN15534_c0_g5::TRINITY_DN15534_c0_g5_i1::g.106527::m.106527
MSRGVFDDYMNEEPVLLGAAARQATVPQPDSSQPSAVFARGGSSTTFGGSSLLMGMAPAAAPSPAAGLPPRHPVDGGVRLPLATEGGTPQRTGYQDPGLERELERLRQSVAIKDEMIKEQELEVAAAEEATNELQRRLLAGESEIERLRSEGSRRTGGDAALRAELRNSAEEIDRLRNELIEADEERRRGSELAEQAGLLLAKVQEDNDKAHGVLTGALEQLPRSEDGDPPEDLSALAEYAMRAWERELHAVEADARKVSHGDSNARLIDELEELRRSEKGLREDLRRARQEVMEADRRRTEQVGALEEETKRLQQQLADGLAQREGTERQQKREAELAADLEEARRQCVALESRCSDVTETLARTQGDLARLRDAPAQNRASPKRPPPSKPDDSALASPIFCGSPTVRFPELHRGELEKLGSGGAQKRSVWKKRFFVADRDCLQYFEKAADYEAGLAQGRQSFTGVRFFQHQMAFVAQFSERPAPQHPAASASGIPVDTAVHPRANEPKYYYFGFVPKKDNALASQFHLHDRKFLLRTTDKQAWIEWCSFISRMYNPKLWYRSFPDLCGQEGPARPEGAVLAPGVLAITPAPVGSPYTSPQHTPMDSVPPPSLRAAPPPPPRPPPALVQPSPTSTAAPAPAAPGGGDSSELQSLRNARGVLSEELRRSEEQMQSLLDQQEPLRRRVEIAEGSRSELQEALRARDREVARQSDELQARVSAIASLQEELRSAEAQIAAQADAIGIAREEAVRLREQLQGAHDREYEAAQSPNAAAAVAAPAADPPPLRAPPPPQPSTIGPEVEDLTRRLTEVREANRNLTVEQQAVRDKLRVQERTHDAQIAMFCDQVLRDMDAIRQHSQGELERREKEWQRELVIWQQLVAEKEQQLVAAARRCVGDEDGLDEVRHEQWRVVGESPPRGAPVVLTLRLSQSPVDFGSFGTRVAVDRECLSQMSVVDDPAGRDGQSMHRTWRFMSLGGEQTTVVLSLAIVPSACLSPPRGQTRQRITVGPRSGRQAPPARSQSGTRKGPRSGGAGRRL